MLCALILIGVQELLTLLELFQSERVKKSKAVHSLDMTIFCGNTFPHNKNAKMGEYIGTDYRNVEYASEYPPFQDS